MSEVIDGLARKLKRAHRDLARANAAFDVARDEYDRRHQERSAANKRVDELERAISLLRNGLKPSSVPGGITYFTPPKRGG